MDKGVLKIKGRELHFLSEHELSDRARDPLEPPPETIRPSPAAPPTSSTPAPVTFPGDDHTIGSAPDPTSPLEPNIEMLMSLGFTRESVVSALESAGGNVEVATSLLF